MSWVVCLSFLSHLHNPLLPMVQPQESEPALSRASANLSSEHANRQVVEEQLFVAKTVLQQAIDLLANHITSDDQLTVHSKYMPGSTIGQFVCLHRTWIIPSTEHKANISDMLSTITSCFWIACLVILHASSRMTLGFGIPPWRQTAKVRKKLCRIRSLSWKRSFRPWTLTRKLHWMQ